MDEELTDPIVPPEVRASIRAIVSDLEAELVAIRRDLHAHPEPARAEQRSTELVAGRLSAAGLNPHRMPGTGLICDFGPGSQATGRGRIALRADLDALPIDEQTDLSFASTVPGFAHACGHDVHTTVVLGASLVLAELHRRGELDIGVRALFQPAEEVQPSGALDAIQSGAIEGVDQIFALHCDPRVDAGQVGIRPGAITSASDLLAIYLTGAGGHTSRPHLTQDVVFALGAIITGLPAVLGRRLDPRAGVNLTFGVVHAGSVHNAIPATGVLEGTLRVLDVSAWEEAKRVVVDAVHHLAEPYGVQVDVHHQRGVPPVNNDAEATALISSAARVALGESNVLIAEQSLGGEDFAWYLTSVRGAMMRLGTRRAGGPTYDLHSGDFRVDERAIAVGVRVLVATVLLAALREL